MLTIREVAEELQCSPQAIYKKIDNQLAKELKPYVKQVKQGSRMIKMIEATGVSIIKDSMEQPFNQPDNKEQPTQDNQIEDELLELLQKNIEIFRNQLAAKDKQLEAKDEQIKELNSMIKGHQESNKNNQILLHRQQDQKLIKEKITFVVKIKRLFQNTK